MEAHRVSPYSGAVKATESEEQKDFEYAVEILAGLRIDPLQLLEALQRGLALQTEETLRKRDRGDSRAGAVANDLRDAMRDVNRGLVQLWQKVREKEFSNDNIPF